MRPISRPPIFFTVVILLLLSLNVAAQDQLPFPTHTTKDVRSGGFLVPNSSYVGSQSDDNALFGKSVAVTTDLMVVGAAGETVSGHAKAGAVYIYAPDGSGGWQEIQRIGSPVPSAHAYFGYSVALYGHGLDAWIVVGAPYSNSINGKVYIFKPDVTPGTWVFNTSLFSPQPSNGLFGYTIDIWDSGIPNNPSMLVGAPQEQSGSGKGGAVYLYQFTGGFPDGSERFASPEDVDNTFFGASIARADNSSTPTFFVGAPGYSISDPFQPGLGRVYSFYNFSSYLSGPVFDSPNTQITGNFGASLSTHPLGGNTLLAVGAPGEHVNASREGRVYLLDIDIAIPSITVEDTIPLNASPPVSLGRFGTSVDLQTTESALRLLVGAPTDNDQGNAYLFDGSSGTWQEQQNLMGGDTTSHDGFGNAVALYEMSGKTYAFVGASIDDPNTDAPPAIPGVVHVFSRPGPGLSIESLYAEPYTVSENGALTFEFNLSLTTQPTDDVNITIDYTGEDCIIGDPIRDDNEDITFTSANWNIAQEVRILAINDDIVENIESCAFYISTDSSDTDYDNLFGSLAVEVISDDTAGLNLDLQGIPATPISEDGTLFQTATLTLTNQPADIVHVIFESNDGQCDLTTGIPRAPTYTVSFTATDWNIPQAVQINAVDDTTEEGDHTCLVEIRLESEVTAYANLTPGDLTLDIIDDDFTGGSSTELVRNGGLEDPVAGKPFKPINWTFRKLSPKDKRICPGSGSPKVHSGNCSVQMNGTVDAPRSVLRATRTKTDLTDNLGLTLSVGDTLRVQFNYKLHRKTDALVRLVAFRNFGGDRTVLARVELPHPDDNDYTQWLTFDQTFTLTTTDFKQLRLILRDLSKGGNWWIDDVSLLYNPTDGGARFRTP